MASVCFFERPADCLIPDLVDHPQFYELVGEQLHGPVLPAFGRCRAGKGDQLGFLLEIEFRSSSLAIPFRDGRSNSSLHKPLADASNGGNGGMSGGGDISVLEAIRRMEQDMGTHDLTGTCLALPGQSNQLGSFIRGEVNDVLFTHGEALFPCPAYSRHRSHGHEPGRFLSMEMSVTEVSSGGRRQQVEDLLARLQAHVEALTMVRHAEANLAGHRFAREYIGTQLRAFGFHVEEQAVMGEGPEERNVIARPGGASRDSVLLIEAHYDTVPNSPGADDNASGLAVLLEAARLLGPVAGITFAAFCLEEDKAQGARAFAQSLQGAALPDAIILDMVGYTEPGLDRSLAVVALWRSHRLALQVTRECIRERQLALPITAPGLEKLLPDVQTRGEHSVLSEYGLSAVMLTDGGNLRNPHYHSPTDLPPTLDYHFMARICRAVLRSARRKLAAFPESAL